MLGILNLVEAAQDFTRQAVIKAHERRRIKYEKKRVEDITEKRLRAREPKTVEEMEAAIKEEEMMVIHHNYQLATMLQHQ